MITVKELQELIDFPHLAINGGNQWGHQIPGEPQYWWPAAVVAQSRGLVMKWKEWAGKRSLAPGPGEMNSIATSKAIYDVSNAVAAFFDWEDIYHDHIPQYMRWMDRIDEKQAKAVFKKMLAKMKAS